MSKKSNIFITSVVWLILASLFLALIIASNFGAFAWLGVAQSAVIGFVVQVVIMLVLSVALFALFKKQSIRQTLSDFSFQKIGPKAIFISILMGVIVFVLNVFVANFFKVGLNAIGYEPTPILPGSSGGPMSIGMFLLSVFVGCLLPAVCEEVSHRGLLLKGYEDLGVKKAILISALFFGFMHFDITKFGYAAVLGAFFAYVTLLSRSIFPAMIMHFMNNFLVTYITFSQSNNYPFGKWVEHFFASLGGTDLFTSFLGILLLLFGLGLLLYVLLSMLFKNTSLRQLAKATEELAKEQIRKEFLLETGIDVPMTNEHREESIAMEKEVMVGGKVKRIIIRIPIKLLGIKIRSHHKWLPEEKVVFIACVMLGGLITLASFMFAFI